MEKAEADLKRRDFFRPGLRSRGLSRASVLDPIGGEDQAPMSSSSADLTITLDLLKLLRGTYSLTTMHEGELASYYNPITLPTMGCRPHGRIVGFPDEWSLAFLD